jgi:RNA polymerase sigma factor (sigma-70 family)
VSTTSAGTREQPSHSTVVPGLNPQPAFATTHWSVVAAAGGLDTTRAQQALSGLFQTYWFPLYAYVRRRGHSPHDAQDLTQSFFLSLIEKQSLATADCRLGRFRSFLLGAMNHFLADEWARRRAQKRGGGQTILSLDFSDAETRFHLEPADPISPDRAFDRSWATAMLDVVLDKLEGEYRGEDKAGLFNVLRETLAGPRESQPYATLAARLDMTEGAVRVAVHRLRGRYRDRLRAEIAATVESSAEVEDELKYLFRVMGGG